MINTIFLRLKTKIMGAIKLNFQKTVLIKLKNELNELKTRMFKSAMEV